MDDKGLVCDYEDEYIPTEFKDEILKVLMNMQKEKFQNCDSINIFGSKAEIRDQAKKNHAKLVVDEEVELSSTEVHLEYILYRGMSKYSKTVFNFIGTDIVHLKNLYVIPMVSPEYDPRNIDNIYVNLKTGEAIRLTESTEFEKIENSFKYDPNSGSKITK